MGGWGVGGLVLVIQPAWHHRQVESVESEQISALVS